MVGVAALGSLAVAFAQCRVVVRYRLAALNVERKVKRRASSLRTALFQHKPFWLAAV
jgi:hypothetical protein